MDHNSNQDYQHENKMESVQGVKGFEGIPRDKMINYADKQLNNSSNIINNKLNFHSNNNELYQCPCCMVEKSKI